MSLAWTTIVLIVLLFPGVFFFTGLSRRERFSREVVRSTAVGEVGLAVLIALVIHLASWGALSAFGFDLGNFVRPLFTLERIHPAIASDLIVERLPKIGSYVVVTALIGMAAGWGVGWWISAGHLQLFVRHKWINTVNASMRDGVVTAYVLTTTVQNSKALMYKGVLAEFFLTLDGSLTYVVLKNCSRFFMSLEGDQPQTMKPADLFGAHQADREKQFWDYLFLDAKNIANILFEPSPELATTKAGSDALEKALEELDTQFSQAHAEHQKQ